MVLPGLCQRNLLIAAMRLGHEYLSQPDRTFTVPQDGYFALGDNSYNSYDSRYWGTVPEANLVGRGLLVYWPFNWHWGIIR